MNRPALASGMLAAGCVTLAALAACGNGSGPARRPQVIVSPVLDSIFVGDTVAPGALTVTYLDAAGDTQPTGPVRWLNTSPAVFQVDSVTGRIVGTGPGAAVLTATANGDSGHALIVVSRTLDLTLLLDTLFLMPQDTFTVPVDVRVKSGPAPIVWFTAPTNALFSVDSATGRVTASASGQPLPFVAHAATTTDTVADTGAVEVVLLRDTTGGKAFFTVLGTAIRRARASVRGVNYKRQGDTLTFRLNASIAVGGVNIENVVVTVRTPVTAAAAFAIDSISLQEAFGAGKDFVCRPARPWGLWSLRTSTVTVTALSRPGGTLAVQRAVPVAGGQAISGSFSFLAQRNDMYLDPLGVVPVRGTFVAPLVTDTRPCGS